MVSSSAGLTPMDPSESIASLSAVPILIIDDAPEDLEILQDCLREGGLEKIQTAVGGQSGLAVLADADTVGDAPLVVVVDIRMPPPDGYEVLARIKAMDAGCRPLALAVTGDSSQSARIAALKAGASDFIAKPFDQVELLLRVRNLAEMKRQERELRDADAYQRLADQYRILADNAVDVVAHIHGQFITWISPSAEAAFGWPIAQWIGMDFGPRIHPDDLEAVGAALQEVAEGESAAVRCRVATADGGYRWVEARGKPYIDARGDTDGMIFAVRMIDDQVQAEAQARDEKHRFEAVVANAPSAISVSDLQHRYTMVNETFCQLFGQKSVADVIGRSDDEILPPDVLQRSRRTAATVRRLRGETSREEESIQCGSENISLVTQQFSIRNSAGAVTELVTIRTDVTHRRKADEQAAERTLWEERIGAAIDDGGLLVYSQPIVDIATRETVGEELLVRLRAPDSEKIVPPSEFLPQCHRHGLMPVIDQYMIERAIDLARTGRQVSVNITGDTISDETAMREVLEALTTAGPAIASKIMFEITETAAQAAPATAWAFSLGVRNLGCRVALDDFGTGYGTFTELRHLELDTLKIDLSFVKNMLEDHDDQRVVNTIIFIAREYGLTTVAEGVETQEVLERLAELGADRAQGYLFAKPAQAEW